MLGPDENNSVITTMLFTLKTFEIARLYWPKASKQTVYRMFLIRQ
jgi:hypothetical protein